jgi:hypothetical protein
MEDVTNLPPDQQVKALIRQYFSETGMLFPYINERVFWEDYHVFSQSGKRSIRKSWLGLLNMILAMATSTGTRKDMPMEDRYSQSEVYFTRAKTLCMDHMLTGASVEIGKDKPLLRTLGANVDEDAFSSGYATHDPIPTRHTPFDQDLGYTRSRRQSCIPARYDLSWS